MTKKEYIEFHKSVCTQLVDITARKNADYTGGGDDPFRNFRSPEFRGYASVEQGFLTRMDDKFSRIASFVQKGSLQVKEESVQDTLFDLANYCILMAGYLKEKHEKLEGTKIFLDKEPSLTSMHPGAPAI